MKPTSALMPILGVLTGSLCAPLWAQESTARPASLEACLALASDTARLACYDQASGYIAPTTDPAQAFSLSPIAGHKGYGLAVMVDVLSTMLSGAAYGTDIGLFSKLQTENTGFFIILIDPSRFMPIEDFKQSVDRYVGMMKNSRKAEGVDEIFVPGEIEYRKFEENRQKGVEFSEALEKELTELSVQLGALKPGEALKELAKRGL